MTDAESAHDTVWQLLDQRVAATPDTIAFQREIGDGLWEPLTWQAFYARVIRLRRGLYAAGLRKGDRLALIAPVSIDWELLHHAALSMGVVVVGLDAHDLPQRIAGMAQQAGVVAFATTDVRALAGLGEDQWSKVRVLLTLCDQKGNVELPLGKQFLTWAELDALADTVDALPETPVPDDVATIIFTSGTTGAPKGIAYTHAQVCMAVAAIADAFSFVGHDGRLLCWLPLSNLFQRMVNLAGLRQGAGTYLLGDPRRVMAVVATVSPDIFVGVPRFYEKLYDGIRESIAARPALQRRAIELAWRIGRRASRYQLDRHPLPVWLAWTHRAADRLVLSRLRAVMGGRLRCMVTGSAPTPRYLLDEFHAMGWLLLEAYGMSENVMPMAMNCIDDFRFGTVGRPLPGNQLVVSEDGDIKVKGPGLFSGYLGDAEPLTVDAEGFHTTWDLGVKDGDGYLRVTGRSGDLIKTSVGRRIAPAPIEAHLRRMPGIDDVVLIGNGKKYLVALCSCEQVVPNEAALAAFQTSINQYLSDINEQDRPRGIGLILKKFSIESDEMTPNLKIRREVILSRYTTLIDQIYQTVDSMPRQEKYCFVVTDPG